MIFPSVAIMAVQRPTKANCCNIAIITPVIRQTGGTAKTEQNSTARQGHHQTTTQISYVRRLFQKQKLLELTQNMSQRSVRLKILCVFVFFHNQTNFKRSTF